MKSALLIIGILLGSVAANATELQCGDLGSKSDYDVCEYNFDRLPYFIYREVNQAIGKHKFVALCRTFQEGNLDRSKILVMTKSKKGRLFAKAGKSYVVGEDRYVAVIDREKVKCRSKN